VIVVHADGDDRVRPRVEEHQATYADGRAGCRGDLQVGAADDCHGHSRSAAQRASVTVPVRQSEVSSSRILLVRLRLNW
jgi:hypothetical protein